MRYRSLILLVFALVTIGCRRETSDPDMVAATETTLTDTSGTMSATTTGQTAGSVSAMQPAEKEFVVLAATSGMAEVRLSEIALQKANDGDLKAFAQRMVTDHGRASQELQQLATTKGLALPTGLDDARQEAVDRLRNASAREFDRMYATRMLEDHQKAVAAFENAERTAHDADLRTWVTRTLPVLRDHLQHAQKLQSKVR